MNSIELKQWLRDNSSGVYRPAADAAKYIEELEKCIKRYEDCFRRIAEAHDITEPLQLIAMAENDEENYAEILARHIEKEMLDEKE